MKLRPIQFVYLVVLLSSLRMAGASILPAGELQMDGHYLGSVLCRDCAGIWTEITLVDAGPAWGSGSGTFVVIERFTGGVHLIQQPERRFPAMSDKFTFALPVASVAAFNIAWAMKPPAAQCMTIYSITGSGNGSAFTSNPL
jgi:hypothetical protein